MRGARCSPGKLPAFKPGAAGAFAALSSGQVALCKPVRHRPPIRGQAPISYLHAGARLWTAGDRAAKRRRDCTRRAHPVGSGAVLAGAHKAQLVRFTLASAG